MNPPTSNPLLEAVEQVFKSPGDEGWAREAARLLASQIAGRALAQLKECRPRLQVLEATLGGLSAKGDWQARFGYGVAYTLREVCVQYLETATRDIAQATIDACLHRKLNRVILRLLARETLLPSQLAQKLTKDVTAISRALGELGRAGLVAVASPAGGDPDRRARPYKATELGHQEIEKRGLAAAPSEPSSPKARRAAKRKGTRSGGPNQTPPSPPPAPQPSPEDLALLRDLFDRLVETDVVELSERECALLARVNPRIRDSLGSESRPRVPVDDLLASLPSSPGDTTDPVAQEVGRWREDRRVIRDLIDPRNLETGEVKLDESAYSLLLHREPTFRQRYGTSTKPRPRRIELFEFQHYLRSGGALDRALKARVSQTELVSAEPVACAACV